jgi:hypothetical protein
MLVPMFIMATFIVILGVAPNLLLDTLILPGIVQMGFPVNPAESFGIISTLLVFGPRSL